MKTRYLLNTPEHMPQAEKANKATRHLTEGQKKAFVFDDVVVVVRVVSGIKQIITLASGSLFYVVPSRKADISLGIATKALPDPQPTPFSADAVNIVTNLTPQLLPAKKSGAGVTASAFKKVKDGTLQVTPVRPGAYDSLKHPGDVSWVSGDKKTVLSWWGGAKYCTGASLFAGLTDAPVVTTAMLDADATSEISDVIDGTVPCAYSTGSGIPAVNNYAWGRSIPSQLEHTLWKNGSLWKKNWPGIAHGLYDKGLNLCTLWGDTVIEEDCWMVRPYVRIYHAADPAIQGDTTRTETSYLHVTGGFGVRLPSGAFREGLFLVMDPDLLTYHFYGKFDPTERKLHLYGVHMAPGSTVPTNGVYSFTIDVSSSPVTGDVTVPGSNRAASSSVTHPALPPPVLTDNKVEWGAVFIDPNSYWDYRGGGPWDWIMYVAYRRFANGEAFTRTNDSEVSTRYIRNRVDDELLSFMESPSNIGRAVATSESETRTNTRVYTEHGVRNRVYFQPQTIYGYDEQVYFSGAAGLAQQPSTLGNTTTFTHHVTTLSADFSTWTSSTTSVTVPAMEYFGVYDKSAAAYAAFAAMGYDQDIINGGPIAQGNGGIAGTWSVIYGAVWDSIYVVTHGVHFADAINSVESNAWTLVGHKTFSLYGDYYLIDISPYLGYTDLYRTEYTSVRTEIETVETANAYSLALSFGSMPVAYIGNYYTATKTSVRWYEADNTTIIASRSEDHTAIDVAAIPAILAYGDLRWPIAQQLTVAPWVCSDSHGRSYKPGKIRVDSTSDLAGNVTLSRVFEEIVFTPGTSQLGPFGEELTTIPSPYSIYDTYTSRTAEFSSHEDYLAGFWEATAISVDIFQYPGVPNAFDTTGPLPASSLNGLEYFWHYDIDPDHTLLFGLPYGDMLAADTRPCTWVARSVGSSASAPVRIGINGLWDDKVVYNSPIFVKKIK